MDIRNCTSEFSKSCTSVPAKRFLSLHIRGVTSLDDLDLQGSTFLVITLDYIIYNIPVPQPEFSYQHFNLSLHSLDLHNALQVQWREEGCYCENSFWLFAWQVLSACTLDWHRL